MSRDERQMVSGLFSLDGRVVIVTGASSGLGAHFAQLLGEAGTSGGPAGRRAEQLRRSWARDPEHTLFPSGAISPMTQTRSASCAWRSSNLAASMCL